MLIPKSCCCLLAAVFLLLGSGCVQVTTSSGDVDQRQRVAEIRADKLRLEWGQLMQTATNPDLGLKLAEKIREASLLYQDLGRQIANHWEDGNQGRGEPINDSEMQQRVPGWVAGEEPVFRAYDDIVDQALRSFQKSQPFDAMTMGVLQELVDFYTELYTVTVYPKGTVADYRYAVDAQVSKIGVIATEFGQEMARYR